MFLEDPASFMADFGSPVIFGSLSTFALFDQPDKDVLSGRVQTTGYCIEYPASDLVGLVHGSNVLIGITAGWGLDAARKSLVFNGKDPQNADSGTFKVIGTPELMDDGLFKRAELERL